METARIRYFSGGRLYYGNRDTKSYTVFADIFSVYKTDKKVLADELVVGNYYLLLNKETKDYNKYILKKIKESSSSSFDVDYVFERNGEERMEQKLKNIYKQVFSVRDDRTDIFKIFNSVNKAGFEFYLKPNGEIESNRGK